jgi:hypothetical protein
MSTVVTEAARAAAAAILDDVGACADCRARFGRGACACGRSAAARDQRPARPHTVNVDVVVGAPLRALANTPLPVPASTGITGAIPRHLTLPLLGQIPQASSSSSAAKPLALDLGCGTGVHRGVLEERGYRVLGVDYDNAGAPVWADAHRLPLVDDSVDFCLSVAVLEHLQHPVVALRELLRVLKPGARFVGTVAFLEPFHSRSFFHCTHLGTQAALEAAGFDVDAVAPQPEWRVLQAQAKNALFPGMPKRVLRVGVDVADAAHRAWWRVMSLRHAALSEHERNLKTAGSFLFVAHKPLGGRAEVSHG